MSSTVALFADLRYNRGKGREKNEYIPADPGSHGGGGADRGFRTPSFFDERDQYRQYRRHRGGGMAAVFEPQAVRMVLVRRAEGAVPHSKRRFHRLPRLRADHHDHHDDDLRDQTGGKRDGRLARRTGASDRRAVLDIERQDGIVDGKPELRSINMLINLIHV